MLEVIGRGAVTVIDGGQLTSNAYLAQRSAPLLVSGALLHVLPAGSRFDLARRVLLTHDEQLPDVEVAESRAAENDLRLLAAEIAAEGVSPDSYRRRIRRSDPR